MPQNACSVCPDMWRSGMVADIAVFDPDTEQPRKVVSAHDFAAGVSRFRELAAWCGTHA